MTWPLSRRARRRDQRGDQHPRARPRVPDPGRRASPASSRRSRAFARCSSTTIPRAIGYEALCATLAELAEQASDACCRRPGVVELPCCYDPELGLDLVAAAERLGLPTDELVRLHAGAEYLVYFIGFTPGLPYMAGVPERILLPRLETPRVKVPPGSVGHRRRPVLHLLGREPGRLLDPRPHAAAPLRSRGGRADAAAARATACACGAIDRAEYDAHRRARSRRAPAAGDRMIRIAEPGPQTTVQDLGRVGQLRYGIPPSGPIDARAFVIANRLVGNADGAAGLECTLMGPRFTVEARVRDGGDRRRRARHDQRRGGAGVGDAGAGAGRRGPRRRRARGRARLRRVLGRASTCRRCSARARPTCAAGWAALAGPRAQARRRAPPAARRRCRRRRRAAAIAIPPTRARAGDPRGAGAAGRSLHATRASPRSSAGPYEMLPQSDRMGARLSGPRIAHARGHDIISDGIALGSDPGARRRPADRAAGRPPVHRRLHEDGHRGLVRHRAHRPGQARPARALPRGRRGRGAPPAPRSSLARRRRSAACEGGIDEPGQGSQRVRGEDAPLARAARGGGGGHARRQQPHDDLLRSVPVLLPARPGRPHLGRRRHRARGLQRQLHEPRARPRHARRGEGRAGGGRVGAVVPGPDRARDPAGRDARAPGAVGREPALHELRHRGDDERRAPGPRRSPTGPSSPSSRAPSTAPTTGSW